MTDSIISNVKNYLDSKGVFYIEKPNGQFMIDGVSYWSTKDKWLDQRANKSGFGLNKLLKYLEEKEVN